MVAARGAATAAGLFGLECGSLLPGKASWCCNRGGPCDDGRPGAAAVAAALPSLLPWM